LTIKNPAEEQRGYYFDIIYLKKVPSILND
jgi:hypothetical protein